MSSVTRTHFFNSRHHKDLHFQSSTLHVLQYNIQALNWKNWGSCEHTRGKRSEDVSVDWLSGSVDWVCLIISSLSCLKKLWRALTVKARILLTSMAERFFSWRNDIICAISLQDLFPKLIKVKANIRALFKWKILNKHIATMVWWSN